MTGEKPTHPQELSRAALDELYASHRYIDAYREHTERRVRHDPQSAVGGSWEEIGKLQFDYLTGNGLLPQHRLLDIGCGTLRAGRHFIAYLEAGHYFGFDLSPGCIAAAKRLVESERLTGKRPILYVDGERLDFSPIKGQVFEFLLAQSVFTHLPERDIEVCFTSLRNVMDGHSRFFFTFDDPDDFRGRERPRHVFHYPFQFFQHLAQTNGLRIERRYDFHHPNKQSLAIASL